MARLLFLFLIVAFVSPAIAAYDKPYIGKTIKYRAKHEDTFVHLARDYNLGFTEMRAANPYVDPWLPGKGTELILPARHLLPDAAREGVVINLPEMRLYAFIHGDEAPSTFPIGIGREGLNTPEGKTKVTRKKEGPTWTPTPRMRREDPKLKPYYPPGPDNPLGTHALYLGWPTYAIHGTNKPFGIGRRISSGCIRMYPENIEALYELIPVGTKVQVVDQPIKLAWIDNRLYLEAHPEMEQAIQMEEYGVVSAPKLSEDDLKRIIRVAGVNEDKLRWPAIRMAIKERAGYPVEIARRSGSFSEDDNAEASEGDVVSLIDDQVDDQEEQDIDVSKEVEADVEEELSSEKEYVSNEQTGQDVLDDIMHDDIEAYIPVQDSGLRNTSFNP